MHALTHDTPAPSTLTHARMDTPGSPPTYIYSRLDTPAPSTKACTHNKGIYKGMHTPAPVSVSFYTFIGQPGSMGHQRNKPKRNRSDDSDKNTFGPANNKEAKPLQKTSFYLSPRDWHLRFNFLGPSHGSWIVPFSRVLGCFKRRCFL